jgi:hypothetical protein
LSKVLNIALALIFITAVMGVIIGLLNLFVAPWEGDVFGVAASQVTTFNPLLMDKITFLLRSEGLYMLGLALTLCFISLVPFRRGEKWAWYLTLIIFGFSLIAQLVLVYLGSNVLAAFYLPASLMLVTLWAIGIILPVKEIFK